MIKVIKHGKKPKFTKTCPACGCEFEYEVEDLKTDYNLCLTSYPAQYHRYILCPDCGKRLEHDTVSESFPSIPKVVYTNTEENPCDSCPNKGGPKDALGNPIAGDSPCQWCSKSPFKVTCFGTSK